MATSAMWSRSVAKWAEHFRIHAVDLIGDAGFSAPSRPSMTSEDHALWLDDVLNALQIRSTAVVGASLGGWVGLDYAIRRTFRVDRLALLAPGGVSGVRLGFLLKVAPLLLLGPWGHRRALSLDMGFDPEEENTAEGNEFVSFFKLVQHHFVARTKPIPTFSDEMLAKATMPVFAVLGGKDAFFDSEKVKSRLEHCMPQAQVKYFPDAGHGLVDSTTDVLQFLLAAAPTECQSDGRMRSPLAESR
jgi:pimeloyl-ACP methyl ester carboxylesterase